MLMNKRPLTVICQRYRTVALLNTIAFELLKTKVEITFLTLRNGALIVGPYAVIGGAAIGGLPIAILEGEGCDGLADRIAELIRTG